MGFKQRTMGKTIKNVVYILLILIGSITILLGIFFQVKYEQEIQFQQREYNLLKYKKRLRYTPALFYLIKTRIIRGEEIDTLSFNLLYEYIDETNITQYPTSDQQKYILHCFYTKKEKEDYIAKKKY